MEAALGDRRGALGAGVSTSMFLSCLIGVGGVLDEDIEDSFPKVQIWVLPGS
jgi:hypothetical protein